MGGMSADLVSKALANAHKIRELGSSVAKLTNRVSAAGI